jgi:CobQ-like glutamine amidotransferase family enzyme
MQFYITHLYPKEMSIYGDMGNILAIQYKLRERGIEVIYQTVNQGEPLPAQTDFYFMGGGQDKEQTIIFQDFLDKKDRLVEDVENGVSLLAICGGYQLLGHKFLTGEGQEIDGVGLFPVETKAPDSTVKSRCIGDLIVACQIPGLENVKLVGFENHGGQTYFLEQNSQTKSFPLGRVLQGFGNNSVEKLEGCVYKHAIGTYLHGSCLPKNPELTNWLIDSTLASKNKRANQQVQTNDEIAEAAKRIILERYSIAL